MIRPPKVIKLSSVYFTIYWQDLFNPSIEKGEWDYPKKSKVFFHISFLVRQPNIFLSIFTTCYLSLREGKTTWKLQSEPWPPLRISIVFFFCPLMKVDSLINWKTKVKISSRLVHQGFHVYISMVFSKHETIKQN
jgi:hypothetical protein